MKNSKIVSVLAGVALMSVFFIGSAFGYGNQQGQKGRAGHGEFGPEKGLNLSDTQKEEVKTLKISFIKEITPIKNELGIKMAELKAASAGDNVDARAVNMLIDKISEIKATMAKKHFANKQKVRTLLNDEQKVVFDAHAGKGHKGGRHGKAMRKGRKGNSHKGMKGQGRQGQRLGCENIDVESQS